jgi:phosphotransferase system enzyme I (PtsI)
MKLCGKPVYRGVVVGEALRYEPFSASGGTTCLAAGDVDGALADYAGARERAGRELGSARARMADAAPDEAKILAAHEEILMDPVMDEEIRELTRSELIDAASAVSRVFDKYGALLGKSRNETMRERAADLRDVKNRLLRCMAGVEERSLSRLDRPAIIVCDDLYPSDTVSIDRKNVLGIVTQTGGLTSHTAIIARSYEIPAVLGAENCMSLLKDGDRVVLDAERGEVLLLPDGADIAAYECEAARVRAELDEMRSWREAEPLARDGRRLWVGLNIGAANDYELSGARYADGSGLFRTEFLYLGQPRLPDEEKQYRTYRKVLRAFDGKPVILRTLDIGGDKQIEHINLRPEVNPFLGLRGLRLCLAMPEIFAVQIRAALRASAHGDLSIMLPMVCSLDEIRAAKALIAEQGERLDAEEIPWDRGIKTGIMIEVPSIALIADLAADEVDFVSIGTNDLCQYLNASDRMNPSVKHCYQEYHPAMFRVLGMCAREFGAAGVPVSVCGEMGGDVLALPALIGLGIDKFSVGSASLPAVKRLIRGLDMSGARALAAEVQRVKTEGEALALLRSFAGEMS